MNGSKWFLVIIIGAALLLGAASLALAQDDNAAIFEQYFDALWNRDQIYYFGRLLVPDVVHHDSTLAEPVSGNKALLEYIARYRSELPGLQFTVGSVTTEGDQVTADLTATLKDAQVPLQAKARIADGKLVETWFDVNALVTNPDIEAAVAQIEADNLALAQKFVEFNQNLAEYTSNLKRFDETYGQIFSSSYEYHGPWSGDTGSGVSSTSDYVWYKGLITALPDLDFTVESVVAQGDRVYIHYTQTGTFTNPYNFTNPNTVILQPTGKKVVEQGVIIHRVEDGRFVEQWYYPDSPLLWVEMALMLKRGTAASSGESTAQLIYERNQPK